MIKQIIFDVGGVLLDFDPAAMISAVTDDPAEAALLRQEVFGHSDWCRFDRGASPIELEESILLRLPCHLENPARELLDTWWERLAPKEEMGELVRELHGLGYPLYILSNAPVDFSHFQDRIPGWGLYRGVMLSWEEKLLKPDPELYRRLFTRFGLRPGECFFIDDSPANVEAAQWCGMSAFLYRNDPDQLRTALRGLDVPVEGQDPAWKKFLRKE